MYDFHNSLSVKVMVTEALVPLFIGHGVAVQPSMSTLVKVTDPVIPAMILATILINVPELKSEIPPEENSNRVLNDIHELLIQLSHLTPPICFDVPNFNRVVHPVSGMLEETL